MSNRLVLNSGFLCVTLAAGACASSSDPPAATSTGTNAGGGGSGSGSGGSAGSVGSGVSVGSAGSVVAAGSGGSAGSSSATGSGGDTGSGGQTGTGGSGGGSGGQSGSGGSGTGGSAADASVDGPADAAIDAPRDVPTGPFALTSTAFTMGTQIPLKYKCASTSPPPGMNISVPLSWTPGPAGTKSYAITLNHVASGSAHWAIWDIPATVTSLAEGIPNEAMPIAPAPAGSKQGRHMNFDGYTGFGYLGPCPQMPGAGAQQYRFTVRALSVETVTTIPANALTATAQAELTRLTVPNGSATLTGTQIRQ